MRDVLVFALSVFQERKAAEDAKLMKEMEEYELQRSLTRRSELGSARSSTGKRSGKRSEPENVPRDKLPERLKTKLNAMIDSPFNAPVGFGTGPKQRAKRSSFTKFDPFDPATRPRESRSVMICTFSSCSLHVASGELFANVECCA